MCVYEQPFPRNFVQESPSSLVMEAEIARDVITTK